MGNNIQHYTVDMLKSHVMAIRDHIVDDATPVYVIQLKYNPAIMLDESTEGMDQLRGVSIMSGTHSTYKSVSLDKCIRVGDLIRILSDMTENVPLTSKLSEVGVIPRHDRAPSYPVVNVMVMENISLYHHVLTYDRVNTLDGKSLLPDTKDNEVQIKILAIITG